MFKVLYAYCKRLIPISFQEIAIKKGLMWAYYFPRRQWPNCFGQSYSTMYDSLESFYYMDHGPIWTNFYTKNSTTLLHLTKFLSTYLIPFDS